MHDEIWSLSVQAEMYGLVAVITAVSFDVPVCANDTNRNLSYMIYSAKVSSEVPCFFSGCVCAHQWIFPSSYLCCSLILIMVSVCTVHISIMAVACHVFISLRILCIVHFEHYMGLFLFISLSLFHFLIISKSLKCTLVKPTMLHLNAIQPIACLTTVIASDCLVSH